MASMISWLKHKILSLDPTFPQAQKVSPVLLVLCGGVVFFGILHTFNILKNKKKEFSSSQNVPVAHRALETEALFTTNNKNEASVVLERNIFNVNSTLPKEDINTTDLRPSCTGEPFPSQTNLQLSGILYAGSSVASLVFLGDKLYKNGDSLPQGGSIYAIEKNRIIIQTNKCLEFLTLNYPRTPTTRNPFSRGHLPNALASSYKEEGFHRQGNNIQANRKWINHVLTDQFAETLEAAKASPHLVGGLVKGFVLTNISSESVYSKLGLKDNDIIQSINGIELNDAARAIQTLNSMRNASKIEVRVIRGGQPVILKVNIK
jgi:general secretion pathway protein C